MIQESKLTSNSKMPSIQNLTTVRKDRCHDQWGGLLALIHKLINFSRRPESPETRAEPSWRGWPIRPCCEAHIWSLPTSTYPQKDIAQEVTLAYLDHLMMTTDTIILGDLNSSNHSAWYSISTDTRGTILENMISGSNSGIIAEKHWSAVPGFEPRTSRKPGECSTIELHTNAVFLLCNSLWVRKRVHYTYCV